MANYHETVLVREVLEALHIEKGRNYVDATLGNGGHTLEILRGGGRVLGIEIDPEMIRLAKQRIVREIADKNLYRLVQGNFRDVENIVIENHWAPVSGFLFDLGVTNLHLKDSERGFSFENPGAGLDMRLDPESQGVKASDLLNVLREDQLRVLFEETLEPGAAKWITGRVIHSREVGPVKTVGDLLEIAKGLKTGKFGLSEATLPFLALRIAVNSEIENLKEVLPKALRLVDTGGRLVVISFHSGEDAVVKDYFRTEKQLGKGEMITFKPIIAGREELLTNRRARSAKMRVLEKK